MDEIGRRYLLLALRLGRHLPDLVHAYIGPPDLREVVAGEPLTPVLELHHEAIRLVETAASEADGAAAGRRARFMRSQLTAISAMARLLEGEEISLPDRVELLLGCPIEPEPSASVDAALAAIDASLDGGGSLAERLEHHDAGLSPSGDAVLPVVTAFAEALRRRSAEEWGLPDGERVEWAAEHDRPYRAFASFRGNGCTRIALNVDAPRTLAGWLQFTAHEVYPGHHLERSAKEAALVRADDRGEAMVLIACTPESFVLEGIAEQALGVTLTEPEIADELRKAATDARLTGDLRLDREIAGPRAVVSRAIVNAVLGRGRDGWSSDEARDYLCEVGLVDVERAAGAVEMMDDPIRAMILLNYPLGAALAGRWLEVTGQTDGLRRILAEQLVPEQMLAEIGGPRPLFPGSLV